MEMSLLKDVERGLSEERDNLQPLLSDHGPRERHRRPANLGPLDSSQNNGLCDPSEACFEETPSQESTANNTPITEVPDFWPKKWRRSDRRLRRLNTELMEAIEGHDVEEVERLLNAGANPNATCRLALVSACHAAALSGGDTLSLLLKFGAEKHRLDRLGRTPLHLAAWAGNARQVALLLDFPEDMINRVDGDRMSPEAEEDVKKLCPKIKDLVHVRCDMGEVKMLLPKTWKDNIDHNCKDITGTLQDLGNKCLEMLPSCFRAMTDLPSPRRRCKLRESIPSIQPGWTPLHVAASCARPHCTRLLLASGADPNVCDVSGRTSLDVVGYAFFYEEAINPEHFAEVISMLIKAGATFNTMKRHGINNVNTPLHTAVELECKDAINELLAAGASIACLNANGQTPLHVCVKNEFEESLQVLANYSTNDADPLTAMVDVKDRDGHTVLQAAIEAAWVPGVCIALEAGADVTLKANDGETPVHSAAALGNVDVLNEILSVAKQRDFIDGQNEGGETPLFKAILHGHLDCMKALLNEGASLKITLPGNVNVFHVAAENGHYDILKELLSHDEAVTASMINMLSESGRRGFGPIHFAVSNNHLKCVELLLSKNADIRLRTTDSPHKSSTPLHIAAVKNFANIASLLLKFDKTIIFEVNSMGWFPLHTASHHASRDIITILLEEGADVSCYTDGPKKFRRTAIDMIIHNISKPTEFLEDVFDSYIQTNCQNIKDQNCEITVDYRVLMPSGSEIEQMKVIQAILKTGNRHSQKRLLVHPLVESFLYLKWKALLPFFYTILILYGLFVAALTVFSVSVFFFKDTDEEPPDYLNAAIWGYVVYATISLLLLQELLYMNVKSSRYFLQMETWIKFGSIGLATILPPSVLIASWSQSEWPRHVATVALLLAWVEMMFLLSRFPNWGYYVLMFGKVASNVVKILLTFAFLVIGFSLSFMIQFRSKIPFEGPWAALVKTMVMMTSEFDYVALFDEEHSKELSTSLIVIRLIFVIFLILAAIVLMNLMVGVAVNDINDLEVFGNIRRLAKQVQFLGTLDTLVYNRIFSAMLPRRVNNSIKNKRKVIQVLTLCPGKPRWRHYKLLPSRIRDAIFNKALTQKKQMDVEMNLQAFRAKIDEIHNAVANDGKKKLTEDHKTDEEKTARSKLRFDEVVKHLNDLSEDVSEMKVQMNDYVQESKTPLEKINVKIDQMSIEMKAIKQFLGRLESKLGNLSS